MKNNKPLEYTLDKDIIEYMESCRQDEHPESYLINVLHRIQGRYGYLQENHMQEVAERMGIAASVISGVATFYHFFRVKPRGKYKISVCLGTACYVKGSDKLLDCLKETLGIEEGETTSDNMFSLEIARCLGICGLAPAITVNDKIYSSVTPEMIPPLIKALHEEAQKGK